MSRIVLPSEMSGRSHVKKIKNINIVFFETLASTCFYWNFRVPSPHSDIIM